MRQVSRGENGFRALAAWLCEIGETSRVLPSQDAIRTAAVRLQNLGMGRVTSADGFKLEAPWTSELIRLFAPVLDACALTVLDISPPGAPLVQLAGLADQEQPETATETVSVRKLVAGGQGESRSAAMLPLMGELAERLSLWSLGPDDDRIRSECAGLEILDFGEVLGFSADQERDLLSAYPDLRSVFDGQRLNWNLLFDRHVEVWSLSTGKPLSFPASGVLFGESQGLKLGGLNLTGTNGAAVWSDREGARLKALEELVERDAVARFWYNRLGITILDSLIWPDFIHRKHVDYLLERERITTFCLLETDFEAHVVAAISRERTGLGACFASSASRTLGDAMLSALGELFQAEHGLALAAKMRANGSQAARMTPALTYAQQVNIDRDLQLHDVESADARGMRRHFGQSALLDSCLGSGIRLFSFDATSSQLDIPCMKLLSPDLCDWQPRFGKARLLEPSGHRADALDQASGRRFPF